MLAIALAIAGRHGARTVSPDSGAIWSGVSPELLRLHNRERANHNRPALEADARLDAQAQSHAQTMAATDRLFHSRNGAENVGYGYDDVYEVTSAWMRSPGHRAQILGPYRLFGAGAARSAKGRIYWCTRFE